MIKRVLQGIFILIATAILVACGSDDPNVLPNDPPSASNVTIIDNNGGAAIVGDTLSGSYDYTDREGNEEGKSTFRWLRNGNPISGANSRIYTLAAADSGQSITFEVTPVAELGGRTGKAVISTPIVINSAPTASNITISGAPAFVGDTLTGNYVYTDVDGDLEGTSTYRWLRNGTPISGATSPSYSLVVADSGQSITFEVTPVATTGATIGVPTVSGSPVKVLNSPPIASNPKITYSSNPPLVGHVLTGDYIYSDADLDPEGISTFRWLRNGVPIVGATAINYTLVADDTPTGTLITFEVTPGALSGTTPGVPVVSLGVAAGNSPPSVTAVSITGVANVGNTLTGIYNFNDVDGDAEGASTYRWLRNNVAINGATSTNYVLTAADAGTTITFEVTPVALSGTAAGTAVVSSGIVVNSPPTATAVSIIDNNNAPAVVNDILTGTYTYNDIDGDSQGNSIFRWLRNDVTIAGATEQNYTLVAADSGATIKFEVTPVAATGTTTGAPQISAAIIIENSAPTATNLDAAENYTEDTTLNLTNIVVSDPDEDNVTVTLTLSDPAAGSLNTGSSGAVTSTYNAVSGVWSASGAVSDVNVLLATLTFTPANNYNSNFTITTSVSDGVVTITGSKLMTAILVDDSASISGDISYDGNEGDSVSGTMTATDVDGLTDGSYFSISTQASNGTATINAATGAWTFTPTDSNWFGSDSFTVTVTDDLDGTTTQVVTITLANVDDPATIAGNISYTGNEGDTASGTMTATDIDGLTDGSYFSISTQASNGTASINAATGAWSFTTSLNLNWFGSDSFTVTVTDDLGGTTTQVVTITLANVDDPTTITGNISYIGNEGDSVNGTMTATDVDGLTDGSYFSISTQAGNGTATINAATGAWSFTPTDPNWFGSDSFTVTVTDDLGGTTTQVVNITLANVNNPGAITGDISYNGNEGDTANGIIAATDVDGLTDGSYFSIGSQAGNGTASINAATGAWSFTPTDPNWFGSDSFTVIVTDDLDGITTQIINITLANIDDPATIAGNISFDGNEGDTVAGTMTVSDVDGLTDGSYFSIGSQAGNGTATINAATGAWSFTPTDSNWFGTDSFTVTVTDDLDGTTTQIISITLANVDDPATIAGNISFDGNEGDTVAGTMTASDVDGLTDGSYFSISTQASNGTASINAASGAWSFTPTDPNWYGTDSFTVTVTDDLDGTTTQIISITLDNIDDPATIGGNISFDGNEGDTVAGTMTASDVDGLTDGSYFSISIQAGNGTASINAASGAWSFTPTDSNWFGSDSFTVTVTDDLDGTTTQVVTITLANVDDPATIAGDISYDGNEGDSVSGTITASDTEGLTDGSYFSISTQAGNGTATINAATGAWTFTPTDSNWFGTDSFTVTVTDDLDGTTTQVVTITLANVDDPATITGDISFDGNEGDTVAGTMTASDIDGLTDGSYFSISTQASNGTATINAATGAWTFTPTDPNWFGSDSFTVTVTDDLDGTITQVVNITLANIDDPATITGNISYIGNEGDIVAGTMTATDVDGLTDGSYFSISTQAGNGTATINAATGAWTFTPTDPNWFGSDSFTVTVTDDLDGTTTQVVNITLANVNNPATITGDISYDGNEGDTVAGTMTASDIDGLTDGSYFSISTQASNGTATINAASGAWSFTPTDSNWFGGDSFTVTVTDDLDGTTTQIVTITLANVDDPATIAGDISYEGNEGDSVSGTITATDVDGLTDGSYFSVTTAAANGTALIDPVSGDWSFTPTDPNWFGTDSFTVTVTDDLGGTTTQVINITLANVNNPATISGDISYDGNEGDTVSGTMTASDIDGLTDGSYFSISTQASNGTATINAASGAWSFTPTDSNWFGSDSFTVTVTDDLDGTTTQVVTITLANVDDPATIAGDISYDGSEGDTASGTMTVSDVDGFSDGTYFSISTQASNGTASINEASGAWSFTPTDLNWFGSDSFTVTVTDDLGGTTLQVVSITLANVNDAPTATNVLIEDNNAGNAEVGDTLTGSYTFDDIDGDPQGTSTFRWLRDNVEISGATATTYVLTTDDVPAQITFEVTPVDDIGATGNPETFVIATGSAPIVAGFARYLDSNLDGSYNANDQLIVPFDQPVDTNTVTSSDFELPVNGDGLGSGATVQPGPANNEVTIVLGTNPKVTLSGDFSIGITNPNSPSGIDVDPAMMPEAIESASGIDAIPSQPIDLIPAFVDSNQSLGSSNSQSIALGDVDGDGDDDMVVANAGTQANQVYLNDGSGNFPTGTPFGGSNDSQSIAVADVDGINGLDIIVANASGQTNQVYLNDGSGNFPTGTPFGGSNDSQSIAVADIDGINGLDIIVANASGQTNQVYLNDGSGNFPTGIPFGGSNDSQSIAVADVDGINGLDIIVANASSQANEIYLNDGTGNFPVGTSFGGNNDSQSIAVADVDGINGLDIIVANAGTQANQVYLNNGTGSFTAGTSFGSNDSQSIVLMDVDGDSDLDVIVANASGEGNRVYLNNGSGSFTDSGQSLGSNDSQSMAVGDVDGDGDDDIAIANAAQGNRVYMGSLADN